MQVSRCSPVQDTLSAAQYRKPGASCYSADPSECIHAELRSYVPYECGRCEAAVQAGKAAWHTAVTIISAMHQYNITIGLIE